MSERVAFIVSNNGTMTLVIDGDCYVANISHPNYEEIKAHLAEGSDPEELLRLVDIPKAVVSYSGDKISIVNGIVHYSGNPIHNVVTERILNLMKEGFPFKGMAKFLENLLENPSARAISELYDFLQNRGLPITDDGHILMYKGIRTDWKDAYSGTISNKIGNIVEFPRNKVDDDRTHECSYGLHAGALEYVRGYCRDRIVIVKVNPRDVVSVPRDHSAQKVRVCRYEVLREYTGDIDKELPDSMYRGDGSKWEANEEEYIASMQNYDDDDDDDEYCYECGAPEGDCDC